MWPRGVSVGPERRGRFELCSCSRSAVVRFGLSTDARPMQADCLFRHAVVPCSGGRNSVVAAVGVVARIPLPFFERPTLVDEDCPQCL